MRISDWSSDVCSSDLANCDRSNDSSCHSPCRDSCHCSSFDTVRRQCPGPLPRSEAKRYCDSLGSVVFIDHIVNIIIAGPRRWGFTGLRKRVEFWRVGKRSEEPTSELQSPMRISYAVFCLKKKKIKTYNTCI